MELIENGYNVKLGNIGYFRPN